MSVIMVVKLECTDERFYETFYERHGIIQGGLEKKTIDNVRIGLCSNIIFYEPPCMLLDITEKGLMKFLHSNMRGICKFCFLLIGVLLSHLHHHCQ